VFVLILFSRFRFILDHGMEENWRLVRL